MNYRKIYDSLITRAQTRITEGYLEIHHIIPRCLGGSDEKTNLVPLTPEEHYVAHQLLVKLYPGNFKLAYAATMMANTRSRKAYGWLKRQASLTAKGVGFHTPEKLKEFGYHMGKSQKGIKKSDKQKLFMKEHNNARKPESRAKISTALTGNTSRKDGIYWKNIAASYLIEF